MGKKSPPPKPPDLTPITDAQLQIAKESNELAREYLGLSREQYAFFQENAREELDLAREQADRLFEFQNKAFASDEEAKAFAREVGQTQIEAMNLQMDYAERDRARYESVFLPMQDRYIEEANQFDTHERREQEAARASVDIQRQAEAARNNSDARLRSMGVDPSQMRSASLLDSQNVMLAGQQALAANNARTMVEDKGRAMRADALNVGAGLPAQALAGFQSAGASGAGALNAGQASQAAQLGAIQGGAGVAGTAMGFRSGALNNLAALTGSPMQWAGMGGSMYGQASQSYGNAANTINSGYQNSMQHWKAGQDQAQQSFNNVMSVASMAGGMMMAEGGDVSGKLAISRGEPSWSERAAEMRRKNDPYIRKGAGSGEGGKMTMLDRLDNAARAGRQWDEGGGNVHAEPDPYARRGPVQYAGAIEPMQFAEGGDTPQQWRGALPVRQARDRIPAYLAEGEYVVPADVVRSVGVEKLDKLVAKYHRPGA